MGRQSQHPVEGLTPSGCCVYVAEQMKKQIALAHFGLHIDHVGINLLLSFPQAAIIPTIINNIRKDPRCASLQEPCFGTFPPLGPTAALAWGSAQGPLRGETPEHREPQSKQGPSLGHSEVPLRHSLMPCTRACVCVHTCESAHRDV